MHQPEAMIPRIHDYFAQTLPGKESGHALVMLEEHRFHDHTDYLRAHVGELKTQHNLAMIGLEKAPYMNVVLWAYQDGTLARELGSRQQARDYVTGMFMAYTQSGIEDHTKASVELALDALDAGVKVVAGDARYLLPRKDRPVPAKLADYREPNKNAEYGAVLQRVVAHYAEKNAQEIPAVEQRMRVDETFRDTLLMEAAEQIEEEIMKDPKRRKKLEKIQEEANIHSYTTELIIKPGVAGAWHTREIEKLCLNHPAYGERLDKMEAVILEGRKRSIGSDALTATLFDAAATPEGNSIIVYGYGHAEGRAANANEPNQKVDGTLPDHLGLLEAPDKPRLHVHTAVFATRSWMNGLWERQYDQKDKQAESIVARDEAMTLLTLPHGGQSHFQAENPKKSTPLAVRMMKPWALDDGALVRARLNPLLVPSIKQAADNVRMDWNPHRQVQHQR